MDLLALLPDTEAAKNLLSTAAQSSLAEKLFIVGIIWKVMGRRVANHFNSLESSVKLVASEVSELRQAVTADLKMQSTRLESVETGVVELKARVGKLEQGGK